MLYKKTRKGKVYTGDMLLSESYNGTTYGISDASNSVEAADYALAHNVFTYNVADTADYALAYNVITHVFADSEANDGFTSQVT